MTEDKKGYKSEEERLATEHSNLKSERKSFSEVDEGEKIERFKRLNNLFKNPSDSTDGVGTQYMDFLQNAYKYGDLFKMEGHNPRQIGELFIQAEKGNKIIKVALDFYLQVKKSQSNSDNRLDDAGEALDYEIEMNSQFTDIKNGGSLYYDKLVSMFEWSLNAYIAGGEKVGRPTPDIEPEEIKGMADDLEAILRNVNSFR